MQLVIVNSRNVMNFSVGILQTLVKLVQVEILELVTCSATGTGMLVKKILISMRLRFFLLDLLMCLIPLHSYQRSITQQKHWQSQNPCSIQ